VLLSRQAAKEELLSGAIRTGTVLGAGLG
jgi:hypothetical protein